MKFYIQCDLNLIMKMERFMVGSFGWGIFREENMQIKLFHFHNEVFLTLPSKVLKQICFKHFPHSFDDPTSDCAKPQP